MQSIRFGMLPVFILLAVMLAMFPSHSSAATISVGSAVAIIGGKVKVPVTLSGISTSVQGVRFFITYDSQLLTLSSTVLGPITSGGMNIENNTVVGEYGFISIRLAGNMQEGVLADLIFDIAPGVGMQQISLPFTIFETIPDPAQSVDGSVKIVKAGDCDATGTTSIAEVQSGINMFLGLKSTAACVDFNADGSVSIAEVQKVINTFLGL